jgi:hypothetical protein
MFDAIIEPECPARTISVGVGVVGVETHPRGILAISIRESSRKLTT